MATEEETSFASQFWREFSSQLEQITEVLSSSFSSSSPDEQKTTELKQLLVTSKEKLIALQKFATSAAIDLPKYDQRRSQEEIEKLKKRISEIESSIQPKKKFSFSSRSKAKKSDDVKQSLVKKDDESNNVEIQSVEKPKSDSTKMIENRSICIENRSNESLIDLTDEVRIDSNFQVYLKDCENCTVSVRAVIGSTRLEDLNNCNVYLGPCCTSTYVENCKNCVFFIRCHQLRIHHAYDSQFYVYVNSHPIIEDCSGLQFAPYTASYPGIDADADEAKLKTARNWDNVVDFRWHRTTASPNWSVLSEESRLPTINAEAWRIEAADITEDDEI